MNTKKYLRILLPIVILLVVAGIWVAKNQSTAPLAEVEPSATPTESQDSIVSTPEVTATPTSAQDELFTLSITQLDLELLGTYALPIIIDFGADYCVPCQTMVPILDTIHEEMGERAFIKYVDITAYPELSQDFPISVIPTQVFINADGTPYQPSDEIAEKISFTMYSYSGSSDLAVTTHQGVLTEEEFRLVLVDMGVN